MNKITHEGNDYEVLSLDPESIKQITHARLAGGKVVNAEYLCDKKTVTLSHDDLGKYFRHPFRLVEIELYGIQPLKLLEKVPVEFVRDAYAGHSTAFIQLPADCAGKQFRCVEVTK